MGLNQAMRHVERAMNSMWQPQRLAAILSAFAIVAFACSPISSYPARSANVDIDAVLNDPAAPVAGNPDGDVTIVAFMDYNCPFCKKSTPDLDKFIKTDGRVRLIYKDWPILAKSSKYGAELALAAKYQGKYEVAHAALMALHGRVSEDEMLMAIRESSVDMSRLDADAKAHAQDIAALLKRNNSEADALGLQGTPVFLIGPFEVASALDYDGFVKTVSAVRARIAGK
jgi:protein-disulfide isomerase